MKRPRLNPRKLLIASAGVATVNYAFAAGCGGNALVANLMAPNGGSGGSGGTVGIGGTGPGPVANLVLPPPVAGTGGVYQGPIANLVAPPPVIGPPSPVPQDADVPNDAAAADAADAG